MHRLNIALALATASSVLPASAQNIQPQSADQYSHYTFPCSTYCADPDGRKLQSAMQSSATRPHQKAMLIQTIRSHTSSRGVDWKSAAEVYFKWRNEDEARYLSTAASNFSPSASTANVAPPRLINGSSLLTSSDYPAGSMTRGEEGVAAFELMLKNGRPVSCKITSSSGYHELDEATCRIVTTRSVFETSNVSNGEWSTFTSRIRWILPPTAPRPYFASLTATQTVSRVDPNKIRCQYSDGYVGFVQMGSPCVEGIPLNQPFAPYPSASPTYNNTLHQPDFERALKAARAGDTAQFLSVASMYTTGSGVEKDDAKALFWIQKAEKAGLTEAKYSLAQMYLQGGPVGQDLQKSYDYLNEYIQAGNANAKTTQFAETIKQRVGEHGFSCMTYGFRLGTPNYSQCLMQTAQAEKLAQQQAQLAQQQAQYAQQQALFAQQQYELQAEQYERQIAAEKLAAEQAAQEKEKREWAKRSEELFKISEDLLCPKKPGGGIFREPVAGCGRNKYEPKQPNVNVIIRPY